LGIERLRQGTGDYRVCLVEQPANDAFEIGVASILKKLILKYTFGDSSSVKVETALNILNSIYYIIDAYAASQSKNCDLDMVEVLRQKTVDEMYESGLELIEAYIEESKQLYTEIVRDKLNLPLEIYNDTINDALPAFFGTYDIVFAAHETNSSIDYPLVFDDMSIEGILYIRRWLEILKTETLFCSCFKPRSVLKFLKAYGQKYGFDYKNMPLNLFEVLYDQSIFSVLSGNKEVGLTVTARDIDYINICLKGKNKQQIQVLIDEAVQDIIVKFDIQNSALIDYMNRYKGLFLSRFLSSCDNNNIFQMIVVDGFNPYFDKIVFTDGDRMNDKQFRKVIDLVQECREKSEKAKIISNHIHSLEDFVDLLGADCLFGDEFPTVLGVLGDIELAVLGEKIFHEELRCGRLQLLHEKKNTYKKNTRSEWQLCYIDFIFNLSAERRGAIEELINKIIGSSGVVE
jgi:hypothetical protein